MYTRKHRLRRELTAMHFRSDASKGGKSLFKILNISRFSTGLWLITVVRDFKLAYNPRKEKLNGIQVFPMFSWLFTTTTVCRNKQKPDIIIDRSLTFFLGGRRGGGCGVVKFMSNAQHFNISLQFKLRVRTQLRQSNGTTFQLKQNDFSFHCQKSSFLIFFFFFLYKNILNHSSHKHNKSKREFTVEHT